MNATMPSNGGTTEALLERLQEKYSHRPTPSSLAEFEQENPEFAENKKEIAAFLKKEYETTPLNYLRQRHLISKSSRQSTVPPEALPRGGGAKRPDDDTVTAFNDEFAPQAGLFEDREQNLQRVSFECNVNTQQNSSLIRSFGMLRTGDYVELTASGPWEIKVSFCGTPIGYIENAVSAEHRLSPIIKNPESWGLVGGKVFAQIIGFRAVKRPRVTKKSPQAVLFVTYAIDPSKQKVIDGVVLSDDSRCALGLACDNREHVTIPEGVEEIADWAFYQQGISSVTLPQSLRSIGKEAFAHTDIEVVEIPANVESIGERAFVRGFNRNEPGAFDTRRWEDDGPTRYTVAENNERFSTEDGSLIENTGRQRIVKSVFYDRPKANRKQVRIPSSATVLGKGCLSAYSSARLGYDCYLKVVAPDGIKKIEDKWAGFIPIEKVSLPSTKITMSKETKRRLDVIGTIRH